MSRTPAATSTDSLSTYRVDVNDPGNGRSIVFYTHAASRAGAVNKVREALSIQAEESTRWPDKANKVL